MSIIKVDNNLNLVPVLETSAAEIFRAVDTNRNFLRQWLPFVDFTKEVLQTEEFIQSLFKSDCPKKDLLFEIRYKTKLIGLIALKELDNFNRRTELGYWMIEEAQGKGIMTKSCKELLNHAFYSLNMNRVQIRTATGNTPSSKIPKRLGFTYEGTELQGEYLNGTFVDLDVYRMLRAEWK